MDETGTPTRFVQCEGNTGTACKEGRNGSSPKYNISSELAFGASSEHFKSSMGHTDTIASSLGIFLDSTVGSGAYNNNLQPSFSMN
jgi:hypothetical protein